MQTGTESTMTERCVTAAHLMAIALVIACATKESGTEGLGGESGVATSAGSMSATMSGPGDAGGMDGSMLSGDTTWQPADAVCGEFEAEAAALQGAVVYFWMCRYDCGLYGLGAGDTFGDEVAQAQRSYEALDPESECYLLRTALYECFSGLTCSDVHAWSDAIESPQDGPCEPEYSAILTKVEECGI